LPKSTHNSESRVALTGGAIELSADSSTSEIEVILAGSYKVRNLLVDEKALDSMIANHKAAGVDPAVDREHESWSALQLEPSPAMGWVKALSKRPSVNDPTRTALVATVEWTDVGQRAVAAKHYRYVSAGLDLRAKDRLTGKDIGVMLDHVALVKHPFVQGMQSLSLSASPSDQFTDDGENMNTALLKALGLQDGADEAAALAAIGAKESEIEKLRKEAQALKAINAASDARLAKLEADAAAAKHDRLVEKLDAKIAAFAVDASERDAMVELAKVAPEQFEKLLALRQPRNPAGPALKVVKGESDRLSLQRKAIEERMKLSGESYDEALISLATEGNPLFQEAV